MKHNNRHHLRPRSRGGRNRNNLVQLPIYFHNSWHYLFGNLTVAEAHAFIDEVMVAGKKWTKQEIETLRNKFKEEE